MDEKHRNIIEETLDMFNFHDAEDVFIKNGWQYSDKNFELHFPDYIELKRFCRNLYIDTVNNLINNKPFPFAMSESSRFFILCYFTDNEDIALRIGLEVDSVNNQDYY